MGKQLAKLLKADIQDSSDLKSIAKMLAGKGRGKDTILAHITPREAEVLKEAGGSGTTNPETGLLEFEGGFEGGFEEGVDTAPSSQQFDNSSLNFNPNSVGGMEPVSDIQARFPGEINYQQYGEIQPGLNAQFTTGREDSFSPTVIGTPSGASTAAAKERQALTGKGSSSGEDKPFLSNEQYVRLGLAGGLGVYGAMQQKKAGEQNKKAMEEQQALARPYQAQGKQLTEAAQRGELTAAGQQQLQGLQAQLAQGAESRGGVGAAQAAAQAQAFRNQLLQNQYDYGLKVSQIGDNIALGAIRTGMQLDQQLNQANMAFYTQLGSLAAGIPTYQTVRSP
jgi:hypothetical protein